MKNLKSFVVLAFLSFVSLLCFACPSPKVEQTAPEWAIGTWYRDAEKTDKVIEITKTSFMQAGGTEYITFDDDTKTTVKNTITVRSDSEFQVTQESVKMLVFGIKKSGNKFEYSYDELKLDSNLEESEYERKKYEVYK